MDNSACNPLSQIPNAQSPKTLLLKPNVLKTLNLIFLPYLLMNLANVSSIFRGKTHKPNSISFEKIAISDSPN